MLVDPSATAAEAQKAKRISAFLKITVQAVVLKAPDSNLQVK